MGLLAQRLSKYRKYEPRITPSQWIQNNIVLPPGKFEAKPGKVDWNWSPFLREPLDCFDDPAVQDIIFVAPTRIGKTFLLRMAFAYCIAKYPKPTILFDSTIQKGRRLVRNELKPLILYNDVLKSLVPTNRNHFSDSHMLFPAASFDVYGANSAAGAAGDTGKVVLGNEVDKWKDESDKEASMCELVRHRTESGEGERKHYFSSTPTTEAGSIYREFLLGDQRYFYVPCPVCGHMQRLIWKQVRWDNAAAQNPDGSYDYEKVLETAHYLCENPDCLAEWDDKMRLQAVRDPRAEWRPTAKPKIPKQRSYQINGLYGPLQSNRMGELAVSFLASRSTGFFTSRRDFWNSRMGEVYRDSVVTITAEKFKDLEESYTRGSLPDGFKPDIVIISSDVQTYGFPFTVLAFKWNGESRTVDHGVCMTFDDLDEIQRIYHPLAKRSHVIIDIGFENRTPEVLEAIYLRQRRGWVGADGFEQSKQLTSIVIRDPFLGSKNQGVYRVQVIQISTYEFKVEWEKRFTREVDLWRSYSISSLAADFDKETKEQAEYYSELLDERRVPRKIKRQGKPAWEWKSRNGNNHFFDCHVYALALFYHLSRARAFVKAQKKNKAGAIEVAK